MKPQKPLMPGSTKGTRHAFFVILCLVCFFVALLIPTVGQRPFDEFGNFRQRRRAPSSDQAAGKSYGEYTFVRTIYDSPQRGRSGGYYGYSGGTWTHDHPGADNNFLVGLPAGAGA